MEINITEPNICAEAVIINPDLIYFACTPDWFYIYNFQFERWKDIKTGNEINQTLENSFDSNGCIFLLVPNQPIQTGKWFYAEVMDDVLDFYNSEEYLKYI